MIGFKNRFLAGMVIFIVVNVILSIVFIPLNFYVRIDVDEWQAFALEISRKLLDPNYTMNPNFQQYTHSFTPLFPLLAGLLGTFLNVTFACVLVSCSFSLLSLLILAQFAKKKYAFDETQRYKLIMLFCTSYMLFIYFAVPSFPEQIELFFSIFNLYTLYCFFEVQNKKTSSFLIVSYALSLYTREILWPMLAFPLLFLFAKVILSRKEKKVLSKDNIILFIKLLLFTIILPAAFYLPFLISFDLVDVIFSRISILGTAGKTLPDLIIGLASGFGIIWFYVIYRIKDVFKEQKNRIIILWILYYLLYRLIAPGPLYGRYWIPIVFCVYLLAFWAIDIRIIQIGRIKITYWRAMALNIVVNVAVYILNIIINSG